MVIELLTAGLLLITVYYAWQTQSMVREMRLARTIQVLPKLVPDLRLFGGGYVVPRITNVGPGPALTVDLELGFDPGGPKRRWVTAVVNSGESHDFYLQEDGIDLMVADQLVGRYSKLTLRGSCCNAMGASVSVNEVIDIREIWYLAKSSHHLQPQDDPIEKQLKEIDKTLRRLAKEVSRLHHGSDG